MSKSQCSLYKIALLTISHCCIVLLALLVQFNYSILVFVVQLNQLCQLYLLLIIQSVMKQKKLSKSFMSIFRVNRSQKLYLQNYVFENGADDVLITLLVYHILDVLIIILEQPMNQEFSQSIEIYLIMNTFKSHIKIESEYLRRKIRFKEISQYQYDFSKFFVKFPINSIKSLTFDNGKIQIIEIEKRYNTSENAECSCSLEIYDTIEKIRILFFILYHIHQLQHEKQLMQNCLPYFILKLQKQSISNRYTLKNLNLNQNQLLKQLKFLRSTLQQVLKAQGCQLYNLVLLNYQQLVLEKPKQQRLSNIYIYCLDLQKIQFYKIQAIGNLNQIIISLIQDLISVYLFQFQSIFLILSSYQAFLKFKVKLQLTNISQKLFLKLLII